MDLTCRKGKLAYFRIKELKDVLTKLGLPKQGKKQDLVDRIICLLSDEGVAKIIDDTYRKMQILEAADLKTMGQSDLDLCNVRLETVVEDYCNSDEKICCPCGNPLATESMVQCVDPRCLVRQHTDCVIIPEKSMQEMSLVPPLFFCEMCRVKRADPFWVTVAYLVSPMMLVAKSIPTDGQNPVLTAQTTFQLTKAHNDLLQDAEHDVQAWCILLNDKVSYRMQWPLQPYLQVNGVFVKTINRSATQMLGANGRDDGAVIKSCLTEGDNKISLEGKDARFFCFGVRLVKRRTVKQVLNMIPKETVGEHFEDALARVRRCIGGGTETGNEDSDSDLEVIAVSSTVNLRCPMSGSRMKIAGRFKPCIHMGCFDLETFVELNQRSRKWQCPICLNNYTLEDIIIDPYFNRITTMMRNCGEEITDIEVKPDGSWTAKTKGEISDLAQWHLPDGSLSVATNEVIFNSETPGQITDEGSSGHTSHIGIRHDPGGSEDISRHQPITLSPRNQMEDYFQSYGEKFITMSSSASGSGRDDEDLSLNQESGYIDITNNNGNEINFIPHNYGSMFGIENQTSALTRDTDIIILSDSEEENVNLAPPETVYKTFSDLDVPPGFETFMQDSVLDAGASSLLGLFHGNANDVGMSNWSYASGPRAGSGFQLLGTASSVSDAFIDLEHSSVMCSLPMNGYASASKSTITPGGEVLDSPVCHTNIDIDEHLIDNTLAFVSEDPSLQHFLPIQPAVDLSEPDLGHRPPTSNGIPSDDWISLRLGSDGERHCSDLGSHSQSTATNGLEVRSGCVSNGAASLSGETQSITIKNRKSDGPFSFPRQPRSVRQRMHLS